MAGIKGAVVVCVASVGLSLVPNGSKDGHIEERIDHGIPQETHTHTHTHKHAIMLMSVGSGYETTASLVLLLLGTQGESCMHEHFLHMWPDCMFKGMNPESKVISSRVELLFFPSCL